MAKPASIPEDAAMLRSVSFSRAVLIAVLLLIAAASCSANDPKSKGADAGAGGEAAGQPAALGGDEPSSAGAPPSSGGDATSGGDEAGQGGEAGASGTFSIEGTVHAPKDGDVEGTVVIGCAWMDGGCDEQWSQAVQVSKSGSSGAYTLENLEAGLTYLVLFWKDMNQSGEVDDDDYVGVVADESGAARAFTSAAAGADAIMAVRQQVGRARSRLSSLEIGSRSPRALASPTNGSSQRMAAPEMDSPSTAAFVVEAQARRSIAKVPLALTATS
jgi:hypothetical protein